MDQPSLIEHFISDCTNFAMRYGTVKIVKMGEFENIRLADILCSINPQWKIQGKRYDDVLLIEIDDDDEKVSNDIKRVFSKSYIKTSEYDTDRESLCNYDSVNDVMNCYKNNEIVRNIIKKCNCSDDEKQVLNSHFSFNITNFVTSGITNDNETHAHHFNLSLFDSLVYEHNLFDEYTPIAYYRKCIFNNSTRFYMDERYDRSYVRIFNNQTSTHEWSMYLRDKE